jgi:hypothetical protein
MGDMAEYDENGNEIEEVQPEPLDHNIRQALKDSKANAKAATEARAEVESMKREIAFTKAGIPEDGMGQYFRKGYDGDHSPEAIRAEAEKAGILAPAPVQVPSEELEQLRQVHQTSATAPSMPQTNAGFQGWINQIGTATTVEEVMALVNHAPPEAGVQHFAE